MYAKKVFQFLIIGALISITSTGCFSNQPKVSELHTKDVKKIFKRGKTTSDSIRLKFGDPDEENIITYAEAKKLFKLKNTSSDPMAAMANMMEASTKAMAEAQKNRIVTHKDGSGNTVTEIKNDAKNNSEDTQEVEYWSYNDYTEERPSTLSVLSGNHSVKRRGAKLMLIWDDNNILKDYKFQRYNAR